MSEVSSSSYLRQRHSSYLEVNLSFLSHNIQRIRELIGPKTKLCAMVKGNAYGNGLGPICRHLVSKCGIEALGVASLGEACYLATQADDRPGVGDRNPYLPSTFAGRVIVFSDTELHNEEVARKWYQPPTSGRAVTIVPVLQSLRDVVAFLDLPSSTQVPLWIQVNTGMNHIGVVGDKEIDEIIRVLKTHPAALARRDGGGTGNGSHGLSSFSSAAHHIDHLLTHFGNADADHADADTLTEAQLVEFERIKKKIEDADLTVFETSTSNSAGITRGLHLHAENRWARCGCLMYGPSASFYDRGLISEAERETLSTTQQADLARIKPKWQGKQICRLVTKAVSVRLFNAGESIGYGVYPLPSDPSDPLPDASIVVTLPLGYADGFVKYYTGMTVTINGFHGRIHGGVCMDTCFAAFSLKSLAEQMKVTAGHETFTQTFKPGDPATWPFHPGDRVHMWEWEDNRSIQLRANDVRAITPAMMCCLSTRIERLYVDGGEEGTYED